MRIIKHGDPKKLRPRKFTCEHCGCVFQLWPKEYKLGFATITKYYDNRVQTPMVVVARCPECGLEKLEEV